MSLPVDNKVHELKLGNTFNAHPKTAFHTIRYDFKPASVDTNKEACVEVGSGNQVTITVPHVDTSGISHTMFKGNKQPLMKECVLILDHNTGTYTLEKLTSKITVKKTRLDGSSKAMQHIAGRSTPVEKKDTKDKGSKAKPKPEAKNSPETDNYSLTPLHSDNSKGDDIALVGEISDSSSSSSDDEDAKPAHNKKAAPSSHSSQHSGHAQRLNVLDDDLALSESGSDSD